MLLSRHHSHHHFENALTYFVRGAVFFISPERTTRSTIGDPKVTSGWRYAFDAITSRQTLVIGHVFSGETRESDHPGRLPDYFLCLRSSNSWRTLDRCEENYSKTGDPWTDGSRDVRQRCNLDEWALPWAARLEPATRSSTANRRPLIVRGADLPDRCVGRVSQGRRPRGSR